MNIKYIRFPIFMFLIVGLFFITACSSDETSTTEVNNEEGQIEMVKKIKEAGKIRVAALPDVPGWGEINIDGDYEGYDPDIARILAKKLNVEVEFVPVDPVSRISVLETDKVDVAIAAFSVTEDRAAQIDFTVPYASSGILPLYRKDDSIKDWDEALNKVVSTARGSTGDIALVEEYPDTEHIRYESIVDSVMALKSGKSDIIIEDDTVVHGLAAENPDLEVLDAEPRNPSVLSLGVKQGEDEWRNYLNEIITEIVDSGEANEMFEKWFGFGFVIPDEYELFRD